MKLETMGYLVEAEPPACFAAMTAVLDRPQRGCRWMACLNVHSYVVGKDDAPYDRALRAADWLVPDGVALVWAGRMMGRRIAGRITGPDVFTAMMQALDARGGSVFFLGSTQETLERIAERLARDYPRVRLAGSYSPPFAAAFSEAQSVAMIAAVNAAAPDVLWVGMTAPKQEKWLAAHQAELSVKFAGAVGAVFDFYSGRLKRSHPLLRRAGLEWLHRLAMQPRRHWRRIAISIPRFLGDMALERLRLRRAPHTPGPR
ncbi:WecB/TagA/CpsF family glycosyltransferase [Pseudodonghicola flavimaris]|uniref:WecB/TagA/CpsF family glycosyltransferase n=1 Tax=Pseudodonghicola flavimaris TaxID=3050036 RepID=A0ABT7F3B1_9RHOB|nr:WecB/TagA/CpsF family glycosyltransferase [Pseudodonghicola flavimaris]MDK3019091.1 WecB/TagA/CpsF family glycosyltransferase [Pseudodonghicola flavimaris]